MTTAGRTHQDERFYYLFSQLASKGVQAAEQFGALVKAFNDLPQAVESIRLLEGEADALVHELESRLNFARVTPFDREDVHALTGRLDDIVDHIESAADRLLLFQITAPNDSLKRFADALVRIVREVEAGLKAFIGQDRDSMLHHCNLINEIENEADQIWREGYRDLFSGGTEPLDVLKWKEIYDALEMATDACEDVADVIEAAAVKAG